MTYTKKIRDGFRAIEKALVHHKHPAVLCSFGKDSVLVLAMVRQFIPSIPVIFFRHPFFPKKYRYADQLIQEWNLTVYQDIPPADITLSSGQGDEVEILNHYRFGSGLVSMPVGRSEPREGHRLCGLDDLVTRPVGSYNWKWDVVFHGHKNTDRDPIVRDMRLQANLLRDPRICAIQYPVRDFDDREVFEALEFMGVPINEDRYEKIDGVWSEKADKTLNSDYMPYCDACMRRDGTKSVPCFKYGLDTANISAVMPWQNLEASMHYLGGKNG